MDTILVAVTTISLAIAALLGVLLLRTARQEQRRSEARVNLLIDLASPKVVPMDRVPRFTDFDLAASTTSSIDSGALFQSHEEHAAWPRRIVIAGALAMSIGVAVLGWNVIGRPERAARPAQAEAIARPPLELLSLAHQQQDDAFVITGLVQNPHGAPTLSNVEATVMVFGGDGALLASGRAPLDFTTLTPGGDSPFVIRVAATGAAKYRVAFRDAQDQTLAHVDRRNPDAVARKDTP
jgi:hypothetical protein